MKSSKRAGGTRVSRRAFLRGSGGALALATLSMSGCAPSAGPPPKLRMLGITHPVGAVQRLIVQHATAAAGEAAAQLELTSLEPNDLRAKLHQSAAAGQLPDLALVGAPDVVEQAGLERTRDLHATLDRVSGLNGALLPPLRDLVASGPSLDLPPGQPTPAYGVPYYTIGSVVLARRDLVGSALPIPAPGASLSFDDLRGAAEKMTDAGGSRFGWGAPLAVGDSADQLGQVALLAAGAALFDGHGYRIVLNANDARNALAAVTRLYRTDAGQPLAPDGALDWSLTAQAEAFATGSVVQTLDFGGVYAALSDDAIRASTLALPLPSGPKGWNAGATSTHFILFGTSPAEATARHFIERVLQPDRYDALARTGQGSFIPPYAYLTKGPYWDSDPNLPVYVAATRGDPAHNYGLAALGTPAPATLAVARVRGAWLLATVLRRLILEPTNVDAAINELLTTAATLAREAPLLQPTPAPTSLPFWMPN
ncbi:MAG TPA: extracellular solute-binding protein [Chloroflexota bacterium]|nr:extracellular solute-binding protein [Chloroflexota bacterium]